MIPRIFSPVAMILGAGYGARLRPITLTTPKPLLRIRGEPLLEYHLKNLRTLGYDEVVVNTHYLSEQIHSHVAQQKMMPRVHISHEEELLDTGGGINNALAYFKRPFLSINADVWMTGELHSALHLFMHKFDPQAHDVLLFLLPREKILGHEGSGDFFCMPHDRINSSVGEERVIPQFRGDEKNAPFVYSGIQILSPKLFEKYVKNTAFSIINVWKKTVSARRLHAFIYEGKETWFDTGTQRGFSLANETS